MTPSCRSILPALLASAGLCLVFGSACITRTVSETFFEDPQVQVMLQSKKYRGEPVDQGYSHPLAIAPVRMAHILSRLDVRTETKQSTSRQPALPTESLYVLADHLTKALNQADPTQAVAVYFIRKDKRFGIFDHRYLYSFLTYAVGDVLYIHLSRIDWEIPKPDGATKRERLPEPKIGEFAMQFRAIVSPGMTLVDAQSVAVEWRDEIFKRPTRTSVGRDGKVVRRTILMESETPMAEEVDDGVEPVVLPPNVSSATLRDLADLEDLRSQGAITEAEYNERRRNIIRDAAAAAAEGSEAAGEAESDGSTGD